MFRKPIIDFLRGRLSRNRRASGAVRVPRRALAAGCSLSVCVGAQWVSAQAQLFVPTGEIGGRADVGGIELAMPNAVAVDGTRTWIADEGGLRVVAYDEATRRSTAFGRSGSGPGEFRTISAVARIQDNRVAVLDRFLARISILHLRSGAIQLVTTVSTAALPQVESMCRRAGRFIVSGWHSGKLLHEVDDSGVVLRSFGAPYRDEPEFVAMQLGNNGPLLCIEPSAATTPAVVAASEDFGAVRAYAADGSLLWATSVPGFRSMVITPIAVAGGGISYRRPPEGSYHVVVSVFTLDGGATVLVQVGEMTRAVRHKEELASVTTYTFAGSDGKLLGTTGALQRVDAVSGERAVGIDNSLYPTVRRFRVQ